MKKVSAVLLALLICTFTAGCSRSTKNTPENPNYSSHPLMSVVDTTGGYTIYVCNSTGVMYISRDSGFGKSICVMLDKDGKPQIYKKG